MFVGFVTNMRYVCNMSAHQLVINPSEIFLHLHSFIFPHFVFELGLFFPLSDEFFPPSDE